MKQIARDICNSLRDEPWRWRLAFCTIARDDGVQVWRANVPLLNTSLYQPQECGFGLVGKFAVYFAFRRWLNRMPLDGYRDSDASLAEDPKGLSREAVAARAACGIAQPLPGATP